jgi:hypothetical protein
VGGGGIMLVPSILVDRYITMTILWSTTLEDPSTSMSILETRARLICVLKITVTAGVAETSKPTFG